MKSVLIFVFYLFGFVALVFEPLYYFGCNWQEELCSQSPYLLVRHAGSIWSIYNQWDPLFRDVPLWLRILCSIEVFIFGPLYIACAFGLQTKAKWLSVVAMPFCGALVYSTIVYFAMEVLDTLPNTNMVLVFVVNLPWTIFPSLLMRHLCQTTGTSKRSD